MPTLCSKGATVFLSSLYQTLSLPDPCFRRGHCLYLPRLFLIQASLEREPRTKAVSTSVHNIRRNIERPMENHLATSPVTYWMWLKITLRYPSECQLWFCWSVCWFLYNVVALLSKDKRLLHFIFVTGWEWNVLLHIGNEKFLQICPPTHISFWLIKRQSVWQPNVIHRVSGSPMWWKRQHSIEVSLLYSLPSVWSWPPNLFLSSSKSFLNLLGCGNMN